MKKTILALTLVLAMLLAGCGSQPAATPAETPAATPPAAPESTVESTEAPAVQGNARAAANEISIGIAQDFDSLDPDYMTAAGTKEVLFNVFEGLVKPSPDGEIVPAVASEVVKSEDGLSYAFTLRPGVKFHNGRNVGMNDLAYSIERRWKSEDTAAHLEALSVIDRISTDGSVLTITLSQPSNEFLAAVMNAYIIPADYDRQESAPVGTGPYRFVSRSVQDSLVLERFEDYWGTPGKLDKVTFKILESADGLVLGLQSGALDLVAHLSSDQTVQLDHDEFSIAEGSMNLVQALYLNNKEKPFDDVRVRQALCWAVDKQAVIDLAFDGYGIPLGTSMFPSFSKYYDESLTDYYTPDLEKAKALLTEAGYPDGFEMTITVPSNYTPHVNTATVLVELLREIGVKATVKPVDWGTWLEEVYSGRKFQSTVTGLTSDNMTARKLLERFGSKVGNNFTNYSNADYDEILAKALNTTVGRLLNENKLPKENRRVRLFDEDKMYTYVKTVTTERGLYQTARALPYMRERHKGAVRKGEQKSVAYINHPLTMVCQALSMRIYDDDILTALLLHDVVEDTDTALSALPVSEEARELVRLMTKDPQPKDKEAAKKAYYTALMEHPKAALVKCFDRVNNLSNMALGFTRDHMAEYVEETEKYVVPLIRALKDTAPEYTDPCWLLSYQMYSLLETYKRLL